MKYFFVLLFTLITIGLFSQKPGTTKVPAVKKELTIGYQYECDAPTLNEVRLLNVYYPSGYDTSGISYPVIYVLDGSENEDFVHIVGLVQFLTMCQLMPESIVVGISNVDRKRDFTYPTTNEQDKKDFPTTGGSENFIAFLKQEVIPYIEALFRTTEDRTIIGQSLGGLLATEIFLKHTDMFNQYIIVSPSLWWDDESLLALENPSITKQTKVFVAVGREGKIMQRDAKKLTKKIKGISSNSLHVDFSFLPKENHATVLHLAAYQGLKSLYKSTEIKK